MLCSGLIMFGTKKTEIVLAKTLFHDITKNQKVYRIPLNTYNFHTLAEFEN